MNKNSTHGNCKKIKDFKFFKNFKISELKFQKS